MEISEKTTFTLFVAIGVITSVTFHWALSLFFARKSKNYFLYDLWQLWPESQPFLKAQWPFIAAATAGATWAQLQPTIEESNQPEVLFTRTLILFGPTVISWILMLFFVSYLAEPKYPGRVASIGIQALLLYTIVDNLILAVSLSGLLFFVAPALIMTVRNCLFLPIYAINGHKPLSAIRQSWALTAHKYWIVSRYMGIPIILSTSTIMSHLLLAEVLGGNGQVAVKNLPLTVVCVVLFQLANLFIGGFLYKLYDRLSAEEQANVISH